MECLLALALVVAGIPAAANIPRPGVTGVSAVCVCSSFSLGIPAIAGISAVAGGLLRLASLLLLASLPLLVPLLEQVPLL